MQAKEIAIILIYFLFFNFIFIDMVYFPIITKKNSRIIRLITAAQIYRIVFESNEAMRFRWVFSIMWINAIKQYYKSMENCCKCNWILKTFSNRPNLSRHRKPYDNVVHLKIEWNFKDVPEKSKRMFLYYWIWPANDALLF